MKIILRLSQLLSETSHFKQPVLLTGDVEFKCGLLSSQTAMFISCGHYWKQPSRRSLWVVIRVKDIGNLCCLVLLFVNNPMKTGLQNHSLLQLHLSKINIRSIFKKNDTIKVYSLTQSRNYTVGCLLEIHHSLSIYPNFIEVQYQII